MLSQFHLRLCCIIFPFPSVSVSFEVNLAPATPTCLSRKSYVKMEGQFKPSKIDFSGTFLY